MKLIISIIVFLFITGCSSVKETKKVDYIKQDTITIVTSPNLIYSNDTITTHSFKYYYDTIIDKTIIKADKSKKIIHDTIKINYEFPANIMKLQFKSTPDTTFNNIVEISKYTTFEKILMSVLIILLIIIIWSFIIRT